MLRLAQGPLLQAEQYKFAMLAPKSVSERLAVRAHVEAAVVGRGGGDSGGGNHDKSRQALESSAKSGGPSLSAIDPQARFPGQRAVADWHMLAPRVAGGGGAVPERLSAEQSQAQSCWALLDCILEARVGAGNTTLNDSWQYPAKGL